MSKTRTAWTIYIVLRLLFFAVPFAVLFAIGMQPWLAAAFAALIGVALSVLLLSRQRSTASESIYDWRNRDRTADDIAEDAVLDAESVVETPAEAETLDAGPETPVSASESTPEGDRA